MTLHDSLYYASQENIEFFNRATAGLPKREPDEPYHCGPQCVRGFRFALSQLYLNGVGYKPTPLGVNVQSGAYRVLEIGFNLGHSASCWLELGCDINTMDIRIDAQRLEPSLTVLRERFPKRWSFYSREAFERSSKKEYDLAFIDGAHDYDSVIKDIQLCREHGITRFLFDDWYPHHGPGVQPAVFDAGLLPLAVIGSMAYCVDPKEHGYIKLPEIV